MVDQTDAELLRRYAAEKAEDAFAEFVRRRIDLVYSVARRQVGGDAQLAEDVAQRVFTDAARKAGELSQSAVLSGWLCRSAQFAATDVVRSERRRRVREQEAQTMNEISAAEASVDWEKFRPVLDQVLGELNEDDRDALALRFFEERSLAEIGKALRLTEDAARKRVARALDKMHALLARRGVTSTTAAVGLALTGQAALAAPTGLATTVTGAALAGVATAGGTATAVTLLKFMSTTKIITAVAGAVVLLAVGSAVYQANLSRETEAALLSAKTEGANLRERLAATQTRAQRTDESLATAQKEVVDLRATMAKPAEAPTAAPSSAALIGPAMEYVLEHPETHATHLRQQTIRAKERFNRFFKTAGLAPELQEQVLKAWEERAGAELDFMAVLHEHGYSVGNMPTDPQERMELQRLFREKSAALQANLRSMLGEDRFNQFLQYASVIPERNVADQLASQLYYTDAPLTQPQAEALTQVLVENRLDGRPEPASATSMTGVMVTAEAFAARKGQAMQQNGMNPLEWVAPVTDAALTSAKNVLTPVQLAALERLQAHQLTQLQLAPPPPAPSSAGKNSATSVPTPAPKPTPKPENGK